MNAEKRRYSRPDRLPTLRRLKTCQVLSTLWLVLLVACTAQAPTPTSTTATHANRAARRPPLRPRTPYRSADALVSTGDALPAWQPDGAPKRYDSETLFDFMNGAADLYFTYGFESLTVGQYVDDGGPRHPGRGV